MTLPAEPTDSRPSDPPTGAPDPDTAAADPADTAAPSGPDAAATGVAEPPLAELLPAALLKQLLERLQVGVAGGALLRACASEPVAQRSRPLPERVAWLLRTLKLDGIQAAQLRWSRFDPRKLPALVYHEQAWHLVEPAAAGAGGGPVQLSDAQGQARPVASDALGEAPVLWLRVQRRDRTRARGWGGPGNNPAGRLVVRELFRTRRWLADLLVATLMINVLAVSTSLFAMQVYDRVVPTLAYATLVTLTAGMLIVIGLDWALKTLRARILDSHALQVDQAVSQQVFDHIMRLRLDARPRSLGTLSAQVTGLDAVRQFFSSAAIFSLIDLPFVFLFIALIWVIGGTVAWVYVLLLPVAILLGWVVQWRLRALLREQMIRVNERQGLLVDAIRGGESIRAVNAAWRFSHEWQEVTESIDHYQIRQRALTNHALIGTGSLSMLAYVSALVVGVQQIEIGNLTMGGLIACSILGGRVIAPVAQAVRQLVQWQQVAQALQMVNQVLRIEGERGEQPGAPATGATAEGLLMPEQRPTSLSLEDVRFSYGESPVLQLAVPALRFGAGERVVLLGPVGSGKSTLLRLLAGLYRPTEGRVRLDQADLNEVEPGLLAERIGYLPQSVHLFKGTLRSNLALSGAVNDSRLLAIVAALGIDRIADDSGQQMNLAISEGGEGLSDGQRQLVGLARLLLARPNIWLLDEPAASLDRESEQRLWAALHAQVRPDDIVIISTHRPAVVRQFATRVVVLGQGRVRADGTPEAVLPAVLGADLHLGRRR